jgi:hypothetical protein
MKRAKRFEIPARGLERKITFQNLDDVEFAFDEFGG